MITNLVAIDSRGPILRLEELVGHSVFLQTLLSFIILDLCIYWQHRLFHRIPILWKLHRVHHCDNFFDTTTALRFHVIEILLSYILKICVITIFGISVANFLFFEVVLNLSAMFNHTNIQLPQRFEKFFSLFIVSPSFHRVHHSVDRKMTNSNFGFFLSIWDYLFRSYHPYKLNEQRDMEIGLEEYKQQEELSFIKLLLLPARK